VHQLVEADLVAVFNALHGSPFCYLAGEYIANRIIPAIRDAQVHLLPPTVQRYIRNKEEGERDESI
jgi:hypothetical protein